ncbi:MAG: glutathione ABC transporter substrate-binding protein [Acetobacteraceae bacterium]|nr:glutathione ABC transporter substrate-binding protein [Acetobacteraceae bacterium]
MKHLLASASLAALLCFGGAAHAQKVVTIGLDANVVGLDPGDLNDNLSLSATRTMYQGLFGFDKEMKIHPVLATGVDASEDATEFTFHLRDGVKFQDGTPFDANAVKATFERLVNPANHLKRGSLFAPLKTVEVVDPMTVKMTLSAPFGAWVNTMAHPAAAILSPAAIQKYGADINRHPVGTGPYMFKSWPSPDTVNFEKNPNYWKPGLPKVAGISIRSVPESGSRIAMLQTNEAQLAFPLPVELAAAMQRNPNLSVVDAKSIYAQYVALNTMRKPFSDPRVRQALNYAVDKQAMIKVVFNGFAQPLDSPLPPLLNGYTKEGSYPYDPAKAKQMLAEAGYPNGFESTLWGGNSTATQRAMQFLQQQFAAVGVKVQVEPLESGVAEAKIWSVQKPEDATTLMQYVGWSASTGDADWGLRPLLDSHSFPPKLFNTAYFSDPAFDKDISDGLATADPSKRQTAYAAAQAEAWQQAPWVFLVSPDNVWVQTKTLSGIYVMPDGQILTEDAELR